MGFLHHCLILLSTLIYDAPVSSSIKRDGCPKRMASPSFKETFPLTVSSLKLSNDTLRTIPVQQVDSTLPHSLFCGPGPPGFGCLLSMPNLCWSSKQNCLSLKFSPHKWRALVLSPLSISKQNRTKIKILWCNINSNFSLTEKKKKMPWYIWKEESWGSRKRLPAWPISRGESPSAIVWHWGAKKLFMPPWGSWWELRMLAGSSPGHRRPSQSVTEDCRVENSRLR